MSSRETSSCFVITVLVVLALAVTRQSAGIIESSITPTVTDVAKDDHQQLQQQRNAMTCLSSDGDDDNCIQVIQAQFNRPYQKVFNNSLEFRLIYSYSIPNQTFAVSVESLDVASEHPILFVVRQQKTVTSWELPFEGKYTTFRRTLCPTWSTPAPAINHIVVDVSTSSLVNVSFRFSISVETQFNMQMEEERRMWLTPSENRYFQFAFPPTVSQVMVHSQSPDDVCATVSIQSPQCPVFDTIYNVDFEGFRQTMTGQSYLTIQRSQYPDGFFIVFIVHTDDQKCMSRETPLRPFRHNRTKEVSFEIRKTISVHEFRTVIYLWTLGIYGAFILLVITTCVLVEYRRRRSKRARELWDVTVQTYQQCQVPSPSESHQTYSDSMDTTRTADLLDLQRMNSFHDSSTSQEIDDVFIEDAASSPPSRRDASTQSNKRWRKVSEMTKQQPDFYNKKSKRFMSELCIIAVFYLIPVGQLVWNHKDMMTSTGDMDLCYYNFACAYPYRLMRDFTDFNHFFSNIGYVILGIIFIGITKRRDYIHQKMMRRRTSATERGIPPHYGLSYSMGVGLIVEGILSACYHVCPTRHNYQFDTSFMYVIAALCTLKLYHARHADVNVKSYMAYIFLALVVLLGAGTQLHENWYFRVGFTVCHLAACVLLSIDIYYMGHCEWKLDKNRMVEHVNTCWKSRPLYLERLTLVLVGFVCNVVFAVTQLLLDTVDFNTHILAVFMINQFVYSIFYVVMKMKMREWRFVTRRIYPFLYLLAALAFWLSGSYFFLDKAAKWEGSPAESRMLNQECLVAETYDSHDIWHFLSSTALFFFFNFLLTLDDDIETKPRQDIPVF